MVETMFGGSLFMARLLPVYSLDADLLFDQIQKLILVLSDNLGANQKTFKLFHETFGSQGIFAVSHPIPNSVLTKLYLFHGPMHLFKNIRNNWVTEKMKTLNFVEPFTKNVVQAKWSDLIDIYNKEMDAPIKLTKLSHASLFPTNIEKQKVSLAVNVFNEKTDAELTAMDTKVMVENVTIMWHILNVKTLSNGKRK